MNWQAEAKYVKPKDVAEELRAGFEAAVPAESRTAKVDKAFAKASESVEGLATSGLFGKGPLRVWASGVVKDGEHDFDQMTIAIASDA